MNFQLEGKFLKPASQSNNVYDTYITTIWNKEFLWKPCLTMID